MKITHVLIRKGREEPHYVCEPRVAGFKCGRCRRGNLGPLPTKGQRCRVCNARVTQVITDRDFVFDAHLRPIALGEPK